MAHRTSPRRGFGRRVTTATIPLLLAVGGGNAIAAVPAQPTASFLKIDGVQGESSDAQHPGEIDVKTFHLKVTNAGGGTAGGGGGAGKPVFSAAEFTKSYDKSSPQLLQKVAGGAHIKTVSFTFRRPGTDGFLVYKLDDVVVSSYEQGGDTGVSPLLEHVGLTFSKLAVTYTPVAGPPLVTAGWDLNLNGPAV
jgi:type VI secretion system secreted protein Hcp